MRQYSNLPSNLWPKLVGMAAYLINRSPSRQLGWKTLFEVFYKALGSSICTPNLVHLRIPGYHSYIRIPNLPRLKKLEPRACMGYLVGYSSTNIFKIWIPQRKRIISAQDVTFNEDAKFNPGENHEQLDIRIMNTVGNDPLNQKVEST